MDVSDSSRQQFTVEPKVLRVDKTLFPRVISEYQRLDMDLDIFQCGCKCGVCPACLGDDGKDAEHSDGNCKLVRVEQQGRLSQCTDTVYAGKDSVVIPNAQRDEFVAMVEAERSSSPSTCACSCSRVSRLHLRRPMEG